MANREKNNKNQSDVKMWSKQKIVSDSKGVIAFGFVMGFIAPFGMHVLPTYLSVTYWTVVCAIGYISYRPFVFYADIWFAEKMAVRWQRVAIGAFVASVPMSLFIPLVNWLFFRADFDLIQQFSSIFPKSLVIGTAITAVTFLKDSLTQHKEALEQAKQEVEQTQQSIEQEVNKAAEEFMAQLPVDKRGRLLCLEMSDHYLKVHTDKGHHLILMRFKDAIKMLENYDGLQVHRSWWVATDAIAKVVKDNRKVNLLLSNEQLVPVSKTFQDRLKALHLT